MKTQVTVNGQILEVYYANALPAGYGHYEITVELLFEKEFSKFKAITTDVKAVDSAKEAGIEDGEEKNSILYECIAAQIEDNVCEWLFKIGKNYTVWSENDGDMSEIFFQTGKDWTANDVTGLTPKRFTYKDAEAFIEEWADEYPNHDLHIEEIR